MEDHRNHVPNVSDCDNCITMTAGCALYTCTTPYMEPTIVNMFQMSEGCVINNHEYNYD